jgi:DivIVA domain-containing protein
MDVSPQLLREVEFREKWRGYSADEVDEFLERVATGVEQLQASLREADERATRAERRVLETSDDDVRRALVLAQRTADAALTEAREEADRRVAAAEEQARALRVDAEERAAVELRELAARRAELEADVSALTAYVREHRAKLADELRGQLEWLKAPGRLALPEPPVPVAPPEPVPTEAVAAIDLDLDLEAEAEAAPEPVAEAAPEPVAATGDGTPPQAAEEPSGPIPLPGADDGGPPTQGMPLPLADLDDDDEADVPSLRPPNSGRTIDVRDIRSRHAALDTAAEGDPFLAELRRAVVDDDDDDDGPRSSLEGPDLVDAELLPERRRLRRRRPAV